MLILSERNVSRVARCPFELPVITAVFLSVIKKTARDVLVSMCVFECTHTNK